MDNKDKDLVFITDAPYKKKRKRTEVKIIICLVLALIVGFAAGYSASSETTILGTSNDLSKYNAVYGIIRDRWVDASDSNSDLETLAIKGLVAALGDPHTAYLTYDEASIYTSSLDGEYEGIGVTFQLVDLGVLVTRVGLNSPAESAGLHVGDIITQADGNSLEGLTTTEIASLIRGEAGTTVTLTVLRDGKEKKYPVTRARVDGTCFGEIKEFDGKKYGYVNITTFASSTADEMRKVLEYFKEHKIENLVIDVRDNPGGYLTSVQNILELFIAKDKIMFEVQKKDGSKVSYVAQNSDDFVFATGIILINENSASASEILAAALSQQENYTLVGKTTYGKGTAQDQVVLPDLSVLKYTYAKWLTPDGTCINGLGVEPDYEVDNVDLSDISNFDIDEPLKYDQVSQNIIYMQKMLKVLGYNVDRTDGYFSTMTRTALQKFESDNNLTQDGVLSSEDKAILVSKLLAYANADAQDYQMHKVLSLIK